MIILHKYSRVILELHNICNRKCEWCISTLCRTKKEYMSCDLLKLILDEIYNNINLFHTPLSFSLFRYNEPLFDIDNIKKVSKTIKEYFNNKNIDTFIYIHTNGDYLNENTLTLVSQYIDEISVNDYDDLLVDKLTAIKYIQNISKNIVPIMFLDSNIERSQVICKFSNTTIKFYMKSKSDLFKSCKGGSLIEYCNKIRTVPCDIKGNILVVETNGDIMPCPELYNKFYKHKNVILGNIKNGLNSVVNKYNTINELSCEHCKYCVLSSKTCDIVKIK